MLPNVTPIEQAVTLTQALRWRRTRSWDALGAAVADLLPTIIVADAQTHFADAGFPLTVLQLCMML